MGTSFRNVPPLRVVSVSDFDPRTRYVLPLFETTVSAGFPSPADDFIDARLDLNEFLVRHPEATFFLRVEGESMLGAGIQSGDIVIVDRALEPRDGCIVVACVENEFVLKRIRLVRDRLLLVPENDGFEPIEITSEMDFRVWGVVTGVVRTFPVGRR